MLLFLRKSLRTQYALWTFLATGLLFALVLVSCAIFSYKLFLGDYEREIESRMEIVATSLGSIIEKTDYIGMMNQANSLLVTQGVVGVTILDVNGNPLIQKGDFSGFPLKQSIFHKEEPTGTIQVNFSKEPIRSKVKYLLLLGGLLTLIGVPLTAIFMWFISGRQLRDILILAEEVQNLGDIESENICLTGMDRQDEIGKLARALAERNDAIRESKKLEQLLFHAIDQSHDSVVITDAHGDIEYVNPAFSRITGYSSQEAVGCNPRILQSGKHPAKFYTSMWECLKSGRNWKGLIVNRRKNGEEYQEEATISPVTGENKKIHHYIAMKRDITQEVVLERKLVRAEKMQAIGLMAGGVAHDLNNILSGVVGYPELLLMQLPKDDKLREPIEAIHDSGKRAATVVADLLTVARGIAATREVADIMVIITEYLESPEHKNLKSLYPGIKIIQQFDALNSHILCSPVHIKKCIMNLVTNASEAIPGSGTIHITCKNQYLGEEAAAIDDLQKGEYVILCVHDSGPGIAESDLEHIFEPFYTKKVMGRSGTGLGLAVVWNTMQDHDGKVLVKSDSDGTSFYLYLPVVHVDEPLYDKVEKESDFSGNGEHILVVDDEPQLRDIASQMLHTLGYKVDSVCSGELAIEFLKKHPVDLFVIDMLMEPGINGRQTYELIKDIYPDQKAIIASGFSKSKDVKATLKLGASEFIKKPYSMEQLGRAVLKALRSTPSID